MTIDRAEGERRLAAHLTSWLGAWPPASPGAITVVGSEARLQKGWDGNVRVVAGVSTPQGTVVSVPPENVSVVTQLAHEGDLDVLMTRLAGAVGRPDWTAGRGVFRWTHDPAPSDDPGEWLPTDDERVPDWLKPFNGDVLVGFEDGEVAAGVGRKLHDEHGHELAVVTEEGFRGRGWAQRLVTQAARRVIDEGAVPTYLHAFDNVASARTAVASGFVDEGWQVLGLFPGPPG